MIEKRDRSGDYTGNKSADFASLVHRFTPLVVHIVRRMIVTEDDAKDIYQDVFLKVYSALPGFRFESKLSTWIAQIAYNTCINHLQKRREVLFGDIPAEYEAPTEMLRVVSLPDQHVEKREVTERLEAEIRKMPVQFRTILTLYHLEDMSYK